MVRRLASHSRLPLWLYIALCAAACCGLARGTESSALALVSRSVPSAALSPRQIVSLYFRDLNRKQYHAAYFLTAPCVATYQIPNPGGAPPGQGSLGGRGPWEQSPSLDAYRARYGWYGLLSARIVSIRHFYHPILRRYHFLGFSISAWLRFSYPPHALKTAGSFERHSGRHVIIMVLFQCHHRWYIDPGWINGMGGPFSWL